MSLPVEINGVLSYCSATYQQGDPSVSKLQVVFYFIYLPIYLFGKQRKGPGGSPHHRVHAPFTLVVKLKPIVENSVLVSHMSDRDPAIGLFLLPSKMLTIRKLVSEAKREIETRDSDVGPRHLS